MAEANEVQDCIRPSTGPKSAYFPDLVVVTHENRKALFYDDLLRGKTVLVHFMSIRDDKTYRICEHIAKVQRHLGSRLGRDVFIYSITVDPAHDTPDALQACASKHGARPGWVFLTGPPSVIETLRGRFFAHGPMDHASMDSASMQDCSMAMIRYGNEATGLWGSAPSTTDPVWIAKRVSWIESRPPAPAGKFKRRGPPPLALASLLLFAAAILPFSQRISSAQQNPSATLKRTMQPELMGTKVTPIDPNTTEVVTGTSTFPESDPWLQPPGSNLLPTIYTNTYGSDGVEIPNTLPSTPTVYYNLHDGNPKVSLINGTSPQDDLKAFFNAIIFNATRLQRGGGTPDQMKLYLAHMQTAIQGGLDVLEGNPRPNRYYSGLPLLHWKSGSDVKAVDEATANVNVHQVWYDSHIESDTAYLDARKVKDKPWTITYTIDTLNRGHDDFSPYVMYFDNVPEGTKTMPPAGVGMDQSFFNMEDGTRTVVKIKMAPGKNWSLNYTWGWRDHPPRAQVTESACKTIPFNAAAGAACSFDPPAGGCETATTPCTLTAWERSAFYRNGKEDKQYAIGQLSKYSPARIMWDSLKNARDLAAKKQYQQIVALFTTIRNPVTGEPGIAQQAWEDWRDRSKLPRNLPASLMRVIDADKDDDLSLVYMNNTIYARFTDGGRMDFPKWTLRGTWLKVAVYNLDYFDHGYQNVDFGGARGWENQFKSSVKAAGSGCWFTFGRNFWTMNIPPTPNLGAIPMTVTIPAAKRAATPDGEDQYGWHKVRIQYNYEPSRRIRFYQFDPVHHYVAIFSVH